MYIKFNYVNIMITVLECNYLFLPQYPVLYNLIAGTSHILIKSVKNTKERNIKLQQQQNY